MKKMISIFSIFLIMGCAAPIKTQEDVVNSIKMKVGASDCIGCDQIKTFISGRVASGFYSKKDERGMNSGGWISPSISLGITNKGAVLNNQSLRSRLFETLIYAKSLTGDESFFEEKYGADINHPYRFFIGVHHNSSFEAYESYIIDNEDFVHLPSVRFQGEILDRSCFDKGCVWDETYVIPATLIKRSIDEKIPLKFFFGNRKTKQVQSKDGFNKSYSIFNEGTVIKIPPEYLEAFVGKVDNILRN